MTVVPVTGLQLTGYISPIALSADVALSVSNFVIATNVNSIRKSWSDVYTLQLPEIPYDDASIASSPICATPPEPTTDTSVQGSWNLITLSDTTNGQDCAIGTQPIGVGANYFNAEIVVGAVTGTGAITSASIKRGTQYDETPINPVSVVSTGLGAGATFTLSYAANTPISATVVDGGSGYAVGDTLFILGGIGYNLPIIGRYPATSWASITTTQADTWSVIQT